MSCYVRLDHVRPGYAWFRQVRTGVGQIKFFKPV